jgi:hypothetical protein
VDLIAIHPNSYKHGLDDNAIEHAWRNAFEWLRRDRDDGKTEYVLLGVDHQGRLVELVARSVGNDGYIVFHANTPPSRRVLEELGLMG